VSAIVDAHSGNIKVQSTVGAGTTIMVTIPGARGAGFAPVSANAEIAYELEWLERIGELRSVGGALRIAP
jgi:hypothetical protein